MHRGVSRKGNSRAVFGPTRSHLVVDFSMRAAEGGVSLLAENRGSSSTSATRTRQLLVLLKCLYFLNGFSGSSFGRFATLFYLTKPRSFSPALIGYIESLQPTASAVGNTLFGWVSDRIQRKKVVSLGAQTVSTIGITLFLSLIHI